MLATLPSAHGIALDEDNVYVSEAYDTGSVVKVSKNGGPATALVEKQGRPYYVAVNDTSVFYTTTITGQVWRVDKSGAGLVELASFQHFPAGILARAEGVFWVYDSAPGGALMKLGPADTTPVMLAGSIAGPSVLTAQGDSLYMLSLGSGNVEPAVLRYDLSTSTLSTIVGTELQANDVAVDGENIYYTTNVGLYRFTPPGPPSQLAKGVFLRGIAASGIVVYVLESGTAGDGRVLRVDISSGMASEIASKRNSPRRIAVDSTCIYWTEGQPGGGAGALVRAGR